MANIIKNDISQKRRKGFTLVELLTVVAILAVLAAILIPVASNAIISAKQSSSLARLRGIGQGFSLFLAENENMFPGQGLTDSTETSMNPSAGRWMSRIAPYMGLAPVTYERFRDRTFPVVIRSYSLTEFYTPFKDPKTHIGTEFGGDSTQLGVGLYGANGYIVTIATNISEAPYSPLFGISYDSIARPGQTILAGERYADVLQSSKYPTGGGSIVVTTGPYPQQKDGLASNAQIAKTGKVAQNGAGEVPVLMADFSVQTIKLEDFRGKWTNLNRAGKTAGITFYPFSQ